MAAGATVPYGPRRRLWRETLSRVAVSPDGETLFVTPPSGDPLTRLSMFPDGITPKLYQVPSSGLTPEEQDRAMQETQRVLREGAENMFGFMVSCNFRCVRQIQSPLTSVFANIAGDPFNMQSKYKSFPK